MQLSQRPNLYDYIKVIALISMILDHIGYFLFPEQIIRRVVGRLAFPLFLFLVGYNLSRRRRWSLWIAGIIVQIAIFIAYWYGIIPFPLINILLVIGATRVVLFLTQKTSIQFQALIFLLACLLAPMALRRIDYGTLALAFGFLGYRLRISSHRRYKVLLVGTVAYYIVLMMTTHSFPTEMYGWLLLAGLGVVIFCLLLSKKNSLMRTHSLFDTFLLFISKQALSIYVLHGILLFLIAYFFYK